MCLIVKVPLMGAGDEDKKHPNNIENPILFLTYISSADISANVLFGGD